MSKKQDIKRCLQVDDIDTTVRVNECTRIKYSLCFYFIRTPISFRIKIPTSNIWHNVIYNLQNWSHYAKRKASPDVFTPSSRSNAKKLLFLSVPNSGNIPFYFRYFAENCWNIVVINCLFEARIKTSVTYRYFENGRVNTFEVSVKNISCHWRKPNIICEFKIFPVFGNFLYSGSIRNVVR